MYKDVDVTGKSPILVSSSVRDLMSGWMDGWMDGWMYLRMDGWMNGMCYKHVDVVGKAPMLV